MRQYLWDKGFHIDTYSWSCFNERKGTPRIDTDANIYTDGSILEGNRAGAGMAVWVPKTDRSGEYHIHKDKWNLKESTIFQCEVYAIKKAAEWLQANYVRKNIKEVVINSDCQAAIKALQSNVTTSTLVKETVYELNVISQFIRVIIRWVKAHVDESVAHRGNKMADDLAKEGAALTRGPRVPDLPKVPLSIVNSKIHKGTMALWKDEWQCDIHTKWHHRQTKDWRPAPDASKARALLHNDRLMWSRKVALMTGHGPFNYHDRIVDPVNGPPNACNRCDSGETQDAKHILTRCDAFAELRREIFEDYEPDDLSKITDSQLSRFISESNYRWFPQDEEPEDPNAGEPEDPG